MAENLPIVLIPGLGASPRTYANIISALWKHGSVFIADQKQDDSMEKMAGRILADAPQKFALIGHSMGGYLAFEIIRQAANRVQKLCLMNTSARPDNDEGKAKRKENIYKVEHGKFDEVIAAALPNLVHPSNKDNKQFAEIITAAHHDAGAQGYINQQTAIMGRPDSRPLFTKITVPTLVITGDGDKLIPLEPSQEMADGIKGAELVVVPDAGHMAALEQPDSVAKALTGWLA